MWRQQSLVKKRSMALIWKSGFIHGRLVLRAHLTESSLIHQHHMTAVDEKQNIWFYERMILYSWASFLLCFAAKHPILISPIISVRTNTPKLSVCTNFLFDVVNKVLFFFIIWQSNNRRIPFQNDVPLPIYSQTLLSISFGIFGSFFISPLLRWNENLYAWEKRRSKSLFVFESTLFA